MYAGSLVSTSTGKEHTLSNIEAETPGDMLTAQAHVRQRHYATHWAISRPRHLLMLWLTRY